MKKAKILLGLAAIGFTLDVFAAMAWTPTLSNIKIYTDSGRFYLSADELSACPNQRAQLDLSTDGSFEKSLYSQFLAYHMAGKSMKIVTDLSASPCVIKGLRDW